MTIDRNELQNLLDALKKNFSLTNESLWLHTVFNVIKEETDVDAIFNLLEIFHSLANLYEILKKPLTPLEETAASVKDLLSQHWVRIRDTSNAATQDFESDDESQSYFISAAKAISDNPTDILQPESSLNATKTNIVVFVFPLLKKLLLRQARFKELLLDKSAAHQLAWLKKLQQLNSSLLAELITDDATINLFMQLASTRELFSTWMGILQQCKNGNIRCIFSSQKIDQYMLRNFAQAARGSEEESIRQLLRLLGNFTNDESLDKYVAAYIMQFLDQLFGINREYAYNAQKRLYNTHLMQQCFLLLNNVSSKLIDKKTESLRYAQTLFEYAVDVDLKDAKELISSYQRFLREFITSKDSNIASPIFFGSITTLLNNIKSQKENSLWGHYFDLLKIGFKSKNEKVKELCKQHLLCQVRDQRHMRDSSSEVYSACISQFGIEDKIIFVIDIIDLLRAVHGMNGGEDSELMHMGKMRSLRRIAAAKFFATKATDATSIRVFIGDMPLSIWFAGDAPEGVDNKKFSETKTWLQAYGYVDDAVFDEKSNLIVNADDVSFSRGIFCCF